jgi:acyl transferase domain-containing protein
LEPSCATSDERRDGDRVLVVVRGGPPRPELGAGGPSRHRGVHASSVARRRLGLTRRASAVVADERDSAAVVLINDPPGGDAVFLNLLSRALAHEIGVSLRDLYKALWQASKDGDQI